MLKFDCTTHCAPFSIRMRMVDVSSTSYCGSGKAIFSFMDATSVTRMPVMYSIRSIVCTDRSIIAPPPALALHCRQLPGSYGSQSVNCE